MLQLIEAYSAADLSLGAGPSYRAQAHGSGQTRRLVAELLACDPDAAGSTGRLAGFEGQVEAARGEFRRVVYGPAG